MCDDLISRKAAIDAIEEMQMPIMRSEFSGDQFIFTGMSRALQVIKELPTTQRKTGKWIQVSSSFTYCNKCGEPAPYWGMSSIYYLSNFCPFCGVDMRGDIYE